MFCHNTFTATGQAEDDCILKRDIDSIRVYSCKQQEGSFRTVRAKFMLDAPLDRFVELMLDVNNYVNWQYKVVRASVLDQVSQDEVVYYTEVEAPWPVSNRDVIIRLKINSEPGTSTIKVTTTNIPDYLPVNKGIVRIPLSKAEWKATAVSPSKLAIEYQLQLDLGGAVPPWLVNLVSSEGPYESFRNLRMQLLPKPE